VAAVRGFTKDRDTVAPALWPACFSEADSSDALLLRTGTRRASPQIDRDLLTPLPEHLAHLVTWRSPLRLIVRPTSLRVRSQYEGRCLARRNRPPTFVPLHRRNTSPVGRGEKQHPLQER
jgi:hypothetical protein